MGNEQKGGTSHHFVTNSPNDENQQQKRNGPLWTKNGRMPASKQQSTPTKPSWQMARDVSMDHLSRKATKLSLKQGPTSNVAGYRSVMKKYPSQVTPAPGKPLPIYRVPRIPTDKEVAENAIAHQLSCDFCDGPCIGDYVRCRVCIKTYHSQCLYERGHVSDQSFSLPRHAKQDWCCPECRDLTRLLTHDEINYLIYVFEHIDRNKDDYITMEEFTTFHSSGKITDTFHIFTHSNHDSGKLHFSLMDSRKKGVISWSDFALFYSCKLIAAKNKTQLTTRLSKKELVLAKNLFFKDPRLKIDDESNIIITKEHFSRVNHELTLTLKKKYGGDFIDAVLHENQDIEGTIEKYSVIGWDDFLRQVSIHILLNRINSDMKNGQPRRASIPNHLSKAAVVSYVNLTSSDIDSTRKVVPVKTNPPAVAVSPESTFDESFRKHRKILEKLDQRRQQEELKRKQIGSSLDYAIVESVDDEENLEMPKLKPSGRDERQSISEPWSVVRDMQRLRSEPILVTTTRIQMLNV